MVLEKLCSIEGSYYLGDTNLVSKCKFFISSVKEGNTLVVNNKDSESTKSILCSGFEINKQDFYLVSDGNYSLNNSFGSKFCDIKTSC